MAGRGRILGVDHIGIAVGDPRERLKFWSESLGLELERAEAVASEGVRTWFLPAGGLHIELLEALGDESPISSFIERRGEGLHHVCLAVDDLDAVLARLAAAGVEALPPGARTGACGRRVAFLHPRDGGGVLLELSEAAPAGADDAAAPFSEGSLVVGYFREPRERVVGVVRSLGGPGLSLEGVDLASWEDWLAQRARGDNGPLLPSLRFYPSSRIEKLVADQDSPDLPSLQRRFAERTGGASLRTALTELTDGE